MYFSGLELTSAVYKTDSLYGEEIKSLLGKLCQRFGHQIDTSEEPAKREYINKKDAVGSVIGFGVLRYYICKRCGKEVLFDDDFGLKDWKWYNVLNTKFTKRIVDEEITFEEPKLVLGKPKVILPDVDK